MKFLNFGESETTIVTREMKNVTLRMAVSTVPALRKSENVLLPLPKRLEDIFIIEKIEESSANEKLIEAS